MPSFIEKLFKKPSNNKSFTNSIMTGINIGNFNESEYHNEFDKVAQYNIYLVSSIRAITKNIIQPIAKLWNNRTNNDTTLPIYELLKQPNPLQDYATFLQYIVFSYLYDGNAYILKVKDTRNNITSLLPLPFNSIEPFIEAGVIKYKYNQNGKTSIYTTDDLIHWKDSTYGNSYLKGYGVVKHAVISILLNSYADRYNIATLKSGGELKGVLSTELNITEEDIDLYLNIWEQRYGGIDNKTKTAVLGGGLTWTPTGTQLKDMGYEALKNASREEIFSLLQVPPVVLGYTDSVNYANAQIQYKMFWTNTIKPILSSLTSAFNMSVIAYPYELYYDYSNIEALSSNLTEVLQQAQLAYSLGYSLESITEKLEIPFDIEDINSDDSNNTSNDIKEPISSPDDTVEPKKAITVKKNFNMEKWKEYLKEEFLKGHRNNEKRFQNDIEKYFISMMKTVLNSIKGDKALEDPITSAKADEIMKLIQDEKWNELISKIGLENYQQINDTLVKDHLEKFNIAYRSNLQESHVIAKHSIKIKEINDTVRKQVRELLNTAETNAMSVGDVAKELEDKFKMARDRAVMIARTETTSVSNELINENYKDAGYNGLEWLTSEDSSVRDSHSVLNGQQVRIGQRFSNGLLYPGDMTSNNPSEVIQCRCSTIPVDIE